MTDRRRFYITTAISYPNGKPHIGHAYEAIATDMIARWKRLDGFDVHFLTGVDVHGLKMFKTARDAGVTAQALAERNTPLFQDLVRALDCSNDDFISTLEPRHYRASEEIWRRMEAAGDIYKAQYAGWYSVRDEAYYDESETSLRPDGVRIGPQGTPVEWTSEETFFFRLSAYGDQLLRHYASHPDFIAPPERRNEVTSFVEMGLSDLSISRSTFDWGIPVPGQSGHVMYVWVDALTNYITGVGFPDTDAPDWAFWPADLHVIGKDILRFHAVYWPAFLMSAGIEPPRKVFAHGFLLNRGEKMSKSVGNVVDPHDLIARFGTDAVRYFFLRDVSFGQDGSWSAEAIAARNNADLANDLGNLAQRTLTMVARQCGGVVPEPGAFSAADAALLASLDALADGCREEMDRLALNACLTRLWASVGDANRYVAAAEPWKLAKSDPERMRTVLYVALEALRRFAILVSPAMPTAARKLLGLLGQDEEGLSLARLPERLQPGAPLPAPAPLFPRIELSGEA